MNRTSRRIVLGALVAVGVLATGWTFEKAYSGPHSRGGATVSEPANRTEAPTTRVPYDAPDTHLVPTDSSEEYDRSDLILMQG